MESTTDIVTHISLNTTNELLLVAFKTSFKLYAIGAERGYFVLSLFNSSFVRISQNPIGNFQSKTAKLRCFFSKVHAYKIISVEELQQQAKVIIWEYSIDKHQVFHHHIIVTSSLRREKYLWFRLVQILLVLNQMETILNYCSDVRMEPLLSTM